MTSGNSNSSNSSNSCNNNNNNKNKNHNNTEEKTKVEKNQNDTNKENNIYSCEIDKMKDDDNSKMIDEEDLRVVATASESTVSVCSESEQQSHLMMERSSTTEDDRTNKNGNNSKNDNVSTGQTSVLPLTTGSGNRLTHNNKNSNSNNKKNNHNNNRNNNQSHRNSNNSNRNMNNTKKKLSKCEKIGLLTVCLTVLTAVILVPLAFYQRDNGKNRTDQPQDLMEAGQSDAGESVGNLPDPTNHSDPTDSVLFSSVGNITSVPATNGTSISAIDVNSNVNVSLSFSSSSSSASLSSSSSSSSSLTPPPSPSFSSVSPAAATPTLPETPPVEDTFVDPTDFPTISPTGTITTGAYLEAESTVPVFNTTDTATIYIPIDAIFKTVGPTTIPPTAIEQPIVTSVGAPTNVPNAAPTPTPTTESRVQDNTTEVIFYAIADIPYTLTENMMLPQFVASVPWMEPERETQDDHLTLGTPGTKTKFLIHLGDIKRGNANAFDKCTVYNYHAFSQRLLGSPVPVFVVPGDNEINDCDDPYEALQAFREVFVGFEDYWEHDLQIVRQPGRPENFAFVENRVLFLGLNIVGLPIFNETEWNTRLLDQFNWTISLIEQHYFGITNTDSTNSESTWRPDERIHSIVLLGHSDVAPHNRIFFRPLQHYVQQTLNNQVPLLYLHGNLHEWNYIADPYGDSTNLVYITIPGGLREAPLKVVVDPLTYGTHVTEAFQYDRFWDHDNDIYDVSYRRLQSRAVQEREEYFSSPDRY